jgi:tyrosyl-tRNA synthetase
LGEKLGYWKPVCVHHSYLQGLIKPPIWPIPKEREREILSSIKMSKSKPGTCIFIYDSPEEIKKKISMAFCPEKTVEYNPILEICKFIIFREKETFKIERPAKFGGPIEFHSLQELQKAYREGKLHPEDLKNAVAQELARILEPCRRYFENNKEAMESLNLVKKTKITR